MVKPTRPAPGVCQPAAQLGAFWQNGTKSISLHQRKEEEPVLFLFSHFWGKLSYMSGKIILYDRENYKQGRKNLLLYNFHDVLLSENFNHGKTKSATLQKRNVIFWCKNEMRQKTEKAT